ncbi:SGNH/GDSL hydrolase family protein [Nocardioides sp.]|uniref:SGNH/GDSL hydrolase family protein n=1 Tax=Nocardioides sp. TaxID=35761 RepID=UPI00321BB0C9
MSSSGAQISAAAVAAKVAELLPGIIDEDVLFRDESTGRVAEADLPDRLAAASINSTYARPPKLTLITPNDSISRQNFYTSGTTVGWSGAGFLTYLNAWLGQRFDIVNPQGAPVNGSTTQDVLDRLDTEVLPYEAGVAVVLLGTNDIDAGVPVATITANLAEIYTALRGTGALVVACTILPRDAAGDTATDRENLRAVNAWIKNYCRTARGVMLADTHAGLVNVGTGKALSGAYFADGIHPYPNGAHAVASVLYKVLVSTTPHYDDLTDSNADETNLLANGCLFNTPGYLALPGSAGNYASVPDFAAIPRGSFTIAVWAALDDWTPATANALVSQYDSSAGRSFHLSVGTDGKPKLVTDRLGDTSVVAVATGPTAVPFSDAAVGCLVVTRDASAGTVQFKTSAVAADGAVANAAALAATNLGAALTGQGTYSIFDASNAVEIGSRQTGTVDVAKGKLYRVMMFDDSGATVLDADFTDYAGEDTVPTVVSGETVTITPSGWSIAEGWTLTNGPGNAATPRKVARTDGVAGDWQEIEVTASTTSTSTTTLAPALITSGFSAGDFVMAEVEVEVDGDWAAGSGGSTALSPFVHLRCLDAGSSELLGLLAPVFLGTPAVLNSPLIPAGEAAPFRSVLATPAVAIPAGTVSLQLRLRHGSGATGTARWGRARVRTVDAAT